MIVVMIVWMLLNVFNNEYSYTKNIEGQYMNETPQKIVLLGDSNTAISYFDKQPEKRWSSIIENNLNMEVVNLGKDGKDTKYFLSEEMKDRIISENADLYIICLGLNDARWITPEEFKIDQRSLIEFIKNNTKGIPVLMTNVHVDYPKHFSFDRNQEILKYDNVKRDISKEMSVPLIDVYYRFKEENENGNWDTRIRTLTVWDNSQDKGKCVEFIDSDTGLKWFDNIHYNAEGNRIVADEIIKFLNEQLE